MTPRWVKRPRDGLKWLLGGPKTPPKCHEDDPREPKMRQDGSKGPQNGLKMDTMDLKMNQRGVIREKMGAQNGFRMQN